MAAVHEQVVSGDPEVEHQLNITYGLPTLALGQDWGGAHRRRHIRMWPQPETRTERLQRRVMPAENVSREIRDRVWASREDGPEHGLPDVLRAHISSLAGRTGELGGLTQRELQSLNSWMVRNVVTGAEGMPTRHHWANWMGLLDSPILEIMDEVYPCLDPDDGPRRNTGVPCGMADANGDCGYCVNCSQVMRMMGSSWNLQMMAEAIFQTLFNAYRAWENADRNMVFWDFKAPIHVCGRHCQGYGEAGRPAHGDRGYPPGGGGGRASTPQEGNRRSRSPRRSPPS